MGGLAPVSYGQCIMMYAVCVRVHVGAIVSGPTNVEGWVWQIQIPILQVTR